jgi:hypothetical protein
MARWFMANKIRVWQTNELSMMGVVDTSERPIPGKEFVLVRCRKCDNTGVAKLENLITRIRNLGTAWQCNDCLSKERSDLTTKQMTTNNPFKGRGHTKEAKEAQRLARYEIWASLSSEEKDQSVKKMRQGIIDRYGVSNPMDIPGVKEIQKQNIQKKYQDTQVVDNIIKKRHNTNIQKYGTAYPEHRKESRSEAIRKTILHNQTHHGVDHFFQSAHYKELISNHNWSVSKGETELRDFIESLGLDVSKARLGRYEIDCLVQSKNIGFEYNGLHWHSEANTRIDKNYHLNKTKEAEAHGVQLIHIFEHEWGKRKDQVKGRIRSLLGCNEHRIPARKCNIIKVSYTEAFEFLDKYHIQSGVKANLFIGLSYKGELVAIASFGGHHRDSSKCVMSRFCTKTNYTIIGGLSKICTYAQSVIHAPIISWCDLRWSNGAGYISSGWSREAVLPPDYFYCKGKKVIPKQARMKKKVNTPAGMTEKQHAELDGLTRVWDCGKIRFAWKTK